jgi:hypothetical protein
MRNELRIAGNCSAIRISAIRIVAIAAAASGLEALRLGA